MARSKIGRPPPPLSSMTDLGAIDSALPHWLGTAMMELFLFVVFEMSCIGKSSLETLKHFRSLVVRRQWLWLGENVV